MQQPTAGARPPITGLAKGSLRRDEPCGRGGLSRRYQQMQAV